MAKFVRGTAGEIPAKTNGDLYRYELVAFGNADRFYADNLSDLAEHLIPGYDRNGTAESNLKHIIHHAARVQVQTQAHLNASHPESFAQLTKEQQNFLAEPYTDGNSINSWDSNHPVVLVDAFYSPFTYRQPPQEALGFSSEEESAIIWIVTSRGISEYLKSLDEIGYIALGLANEVMP